MSAPRVSVVLPVRDGRDFVAEALESVLAQSRPPYEVVVVDDGSTDDTAAVVDAIPRVRCLRQPHRGVAAARNAGVGASTGELIAFIDHDDRWLPDKLAIQVAQLSADPGLGFCLAHQRQFLEPGMARPSWLRPQLLEGPHVCYLPSALLVRREVFLAVGPYDEAHPISSDADWFLRAKDAGVRMAVVPEVLLERRIHRANQSSRALQATQELLLAVRSSIHRQRAAGSQPGETS